MMRMNRMILHRVCSSSSGYIKLKKRDMAVLHFGNSLLGFVFTVDTNLLKLFLLIKKEQQQQEAEQEKKNPKALGDDWFLACLACIQKLVSLFLTQCWIIWIYLSCYSVIYIYIYIYIFQLCIEQLCSYVCCVCSWRLLLMRKEHQSTTNEIKVPLYRPICDSVCMLSRVYFSLPFSFFYYTVSPYLPPDN